MSLGDQVVAELNTAYEALKPDRPEQFAGDLQRQNEALSDGSDRPRRRKVLHVSTTAAGGLGTSLLSIMKALDPALYQVDVALGLGYPLDSAFEAAGFKLHPLKLSRGIHLWQYAETVIRLTQLMRRERYEVVHVHGSEAGILARLAACIAGVPIVVAELHGYANRDPDSFLERTVYRWIEQALDPVTDAYVAVSHHVRQQWVARKICSAERVQVIHHALDLQALPDRGIEARRALRGSHPVVGTVCLLEARKGLVTLVEAMPAIVKAIPDVRFEIVGEGPLRQWMAERADVLGVASNIDFLGWRDDVSELMWRFDLLVQPSKRESFGLVFLEAMASRCPVVASRVDGIPEVVADGLTGHLVASGDVAALANAVVDLLSDSAKAERFGSAGRTRVEERFSCQRLGEAYNMLYQRLLEDQFVQAPKY